MSHPKELNYFNQNYEKGPAWYFGHFADLGKKIVGEISPLYMDDPSVCQRIARDFRSSKILVVLRNPFDRAISHLMMDAQVRLGRVSVIDSGLAARIGRDDEKYIRRSLYFKALRPYFEVFERQQIAVLFYEDLARDPRTFLRRLYEVVGADPNFIPSALGAKVNKTRDFRFPRLFRALRAISQHGRGHPMTRRLIEWTHRIGLRELVLSAIQVDRGQPTLRFEDIFGDGAVETLCADIDALHTTLGIAIPIEWRPV